MYPLHSISKSISKTVFLVLIITGFCLTANAKIYLISIPATGSYNMGQGKPFTIDLGEPLYEINEVRFICEGTVTAGLDYWMEPISDKFYGYFDTDPGYMAAYGPLAGAGTYPSPESFSADVEFESHIGATWDFLLDGQAVGTVYLSAIASLPEYPIQIPPCGSLSVAQIQIDAIPLIIGDFDRTGNVDLFDFAIFASAWMTQDGDPDYNIDCDISVPPDKIINSHDLTEFCKNWIEGS